MKVRRCGYFLSDHIITRSYQGPPSNRPSVGGGWRISLAEERVDEPGSTRRFSISIFDHPSSTRLSSIFHPGTPFRPILSACRRIRFVLLKRNKMRKNQIKTSKNSRRRNIARVQCAIRVQRGDVTSLSPIEGCIFFFVKNPFSVSDDGV